MLRLLTSYLLPFFIFKSCNGSIWLVEIFAEAHSGRDSMQIHVVVSCLLFLFVTIITLLNKCNTRQSTYQINSSGRQRVADGNIKSSTTKVGGREYEERWQVKLGQMSDILWTGKSSL